MDTFNDLLKKVFKILKKRYQIQLYSIFNIDCYIDNNYGIILNIKREYDPFSLYSKKTNINVKYHHNSVFLYEIDDILLFKDYKYYIYNNKYYLKLDVNNISIFDNVNDILFDEEVFNIINNN